MACFVVPATEAVVTTIAKKKTSGETAKSPFVRKLGWLNNMLWGGSALLAFEHVWHGELTLWFPFLTNAANKADAVVMLKEMATSGVAMAVAVTALWAGIVAVAHSFGKKPLADKAGGNA